MKIKHIIVWLAFFSFVGCKSTKLEKLEVRTDSTVRVHTETVRPPILDKLTVYDVCDTVTGKPIQFKKEFAVNSDTIIIEVVDNDLLMSLKFAEEIISKQDSLIKARETILKQDQTIVKIKAPKWAWFTLLLSVILLIFPNISKYANNAARKLIL